MEQTPDPIDMMTGGELRDLAREQITRACKAESNLRTLQKRIDESETRWYQKERGVITDSDNLIDYEPDSFIDNEMWVKVALVEKGEEDE